MKKEENTLNTTDKLESVVLEKLKKEDFTTHFFMKNGVMVAAVSKDKYLPVNIQIHKEIRLEGLSNPSDMSIVYALQAKDGTKGAIVIPYGPKDNTDLNEFMNKEAYKYKLAQPHTQMKTF